jgi:TolA-binding protein
MKKIILFISLVISCSFAETSAFGAGSLDSDNPYGLSESEKIIFENKKRIRFQEQKISELSEQIEGMRSVIESVSVKLGRTGERISELDKQSVDIAQSELETIKNDISELKRVQSENYQKINSVLKKLSSMIDKIDSDYVTHQELQSTTTVKKKSNKPKKRSKLSNSQKLKDAVALYRKDYYTKAQPIFMELAEKSYKPATTNYYLGEISYYKKRYSDAIVYYKKSVGYYDKASYMPTLLLHTGISFEKLNDYENRDKFLHALISSYPNSSEAKIAKDHLE